jgi:hypothetical protein
MKQREPMIEVNFAAIRHGVLKLCQIRFESYKNQSAAKKLGKKLEKNSG